MSTIETQLRQAYADESFALPQAQLRTVLRRRRRRTLVAAMVATFAVATGTAVLFADGGPSIPPPVGQPQADDTRARAEACDRLGRDRLRESTDLGEADRVLPTTVVTFSGEGRWLNLYLGDRVIVSCFGSGRSVEIELDSVSLADPDAVWLHGDRLGHLGRSVEGGWSFLVVATPAGTERVEVVLADGTVVPAVPASDPGGRYVAWLPSHPGNGVAAIEEQTIIAYTPDTIYTLDGADLSSRPR